MKDLLDLNKNTMSSLEIAKLTEKEHTSTVVKDIRKMCSELDLDMGVFTHVSKNKQNQEVTVYNLPKRECLILVSGYKLKMRAAIIDRWQELFGTVNSYHYEAWLMIGIDLYDFEGL